MTLKFIYSEKATRFRTILWPSQNIPLPLNQDGYCISCSCKIFSVLFCMKKQKVEFEENKINKPKEATVGWRQPTVASLNKPSKKCFFFLH